MSTLRFTAGAGVGFLAHAGFTFYTLGLACAQAAAMCTQVVGGGGEVPRAA